MIFGLLQDVGDSVRQAGREMGRLVSPARAVALRHQDGVELIPRGRVLPPHAFSGCVSVITKPGAPPRSAVRDVRRLLSGYLHGTAWEDGVQPQR